MEKLKFKIEFKEKIESKRLDQALAEQPTIIEKKLSRSFIRKLIVAGAVYVNGKRVRIASRPVKTGTHIELFIKNEGVKTFSIENFLPLKILYDDEAVICYDKPASLPTQPTLDEARLNLYALAKKNHSYLGMHHRLDRDTSGVVLFTKEKKFNAFIATQFREHLCSKLYVAVVHGRLKNQKGRLESFLSETTRQGKQAKFGSVKSGGKKAITDYHVLHEGKEFSLVELSITTGRTHQIRVHLAELGHPIVGDTLYGSPKEYYNKFHRHLLHAHALTIEHPITHNKIRVESPVPREFRECIFS